MIAEADTEEEWFALAGNREEELRLMDEFIVKHAPDMERIFTTWEHGGAGLGYGTISYRTKASAEPTVIPVLGLAAQKRHLALYACAVVDGQHLAEIYQEQLGKVSCGKSCIRFTRFDRINPDGLAAMLADVNERYARGDHLYGH